MSEQKLFKKRDTRLLFAFTESSYVMGQMGLEASRSEGSGCINTGAEVRYQRTNKKQTEHSDKIW